MGEGLITHFDAPFATIRWDGEVGAVCVEWKEALDSASFRRALDIGLGLLEQKRSRKWLGDLRSMGVITPEDTRWANESWVPRSVTAGLRFLALVQPRKIVVQMAVKMFLSRVGGVDLTTNHFDDVEDARRWLRGQR